MNLFKHQIEARDFILRNGGSGALFMEMGTGKTRVAIEIFSKLKEETLNLKLLVVAPLSLLDAAWRADVERFSEFKYHNWHDDGELINNNFDIIGINYESFIQEKNLIKILKLTNTYPFMICVDESSRMKNFKAKTTKTLLAIRNRFKYRIIMSGTPAPNCEHEYWGQIEFISPGLLHPSFYAFRNTFFHLERNGQIMIQQGKYLPKDTARDLFSKGWKYSITDFKRNELMKRLNPYCYRIKKLDCLDLPDQIDETRLIEMGAMQKKIYKEMKNHLITEISGSEITAQAALTKIMKLREITSGFALNEKSESKEIEDAKKINELLSVIEEAGNQQVIIWCNFHWEIRKLREELSKLGSVVTLFSETTDRNESIRDFLSGGARFMIAHPRSAAHGLTFVNCSLQIFFSLDWSLESYEQARARIHRAGQTKKCTYIHLLCKDSIDQEIYSVLKRKGDMQEVLYKMAIRNRQEVLL